MGLAASQARLLTITSRKSRAQFESMRYSHQRLALSRNLTDISNEYQKSLDQTKLYYDFYGVNSTDTPLTYGLLMSPSSLNDYTPTLISNNQGRIILSSPYAAAAKAAGVPPEGLGCTPSSLMRNAFVQSLAQNGIITQATADSICAIDYNQGAGLGNDNLVNTITETGTYDDLLTFLETTTIDGLLDLTTEYHSSKLDVFSDLGNGNFAIYNGDDQEYNNVTATDNIDSISLATLLNGKYNIYLGQEGGEKNDGKDGTLDILYNSVRNICNALGDQLASKVDGAADAIAYANSQMNTELWGIDFAGSTDGYTTDLGGDVWSLKDNAVQNIQHGRLPQWWEYLIPGWDVFAFFTGAFKDVKDHQVDQTSLYGSQNFLCFSSGWGKSGWMHDSPNCQSTVDLSSFVRGWFTYFMQYMQGLGSAGANELSVKWGEAKINQKFANKDNLKDYMFTFTTKVVSDNEALIANFYDTLFNQICANGWTENNQVAEDSSYLKEMLQTGMMYVTSMSDDYYYYQNNYATNTFIKEVSDDAAIAAAESKYRTEKARINAKEQEIDLKMKNLDTEISSLETEYEAVKKVIEGNVSKSFTRYDS